MARCLACPDERYDRLELLAAAGAAGLSSTPRVLRVLTMPAAAFDQLLLDCRQQQAQRQLQYLQQKQQQQQGQASSVQASPGAAGSAAETLGDEWEWEEGEGQWDDAEADAPRRAGAYRESGLLLGEVGFELEPLTAGGAWRQAQQQRPRQQAQVAGAPV